MIKEIKRPDGIVTQSYTYGMSLLSCKGIPAHPVRGCKEEMYHLLGKAVCFNYDDASQARVLGQKLVRNVLNLEDPGVIMFLGASKFESARRINKIVNFLATKQGLKKPTVFLYEGTNAVVIRFDKWYYRSPVAFSGLLTFIRGAARTSFPFDSLEDYLTKVKAPGNLAGSDSTHIVYAEANGNMIGFLEKNLPTFVNKDGWRGRTSTRPWDGIAAYNSAEPNYHNISIDAPDAS